VSTTPAQSAQYPAGSPPPQVKVVFDEGVTATPSSIGVYNGSGKAVATTNVPSPDPKSIDAGLPPLDDGTYVVVWHVVSDDGHPEQGAFTFTVGAGGASIANIGSLLASRSSGKGIGIAFDIDRALAFLAALVLVGGLVFTRWRWPAALERYDVRVLLLGAAVVAFVATLASIPLQAAYALGGGVSTLFNRSALGDVMKERFGEAALARLVLIAIAGFMVLPRPRKQTAKSAGIPVLATLVALAVVETFAYAGHGDTGRLSQLGFVADMAHLGGAALWLGGLAVLALVLRHHSMSSADIDSTASGVARFSRIALPAVGVIVLSGVVQGWRQVGTLSALWDTTYGHLLAIKVLGVLAIIIIASAARDAVRDRAASGDVATITELRTGVWLEAGLAVAVLLVTATLVVTPPAREAEAIANRPTAHTVQVDASGQRLAYSVAVQPALPGENTIVVTPRRNGQTGFLPVSLNAAVRTAGQQSSTSLTFTPLADGRFVTTAQLANGGDWDLDIADTSPSSGADGKASARFAIP
jgi:copper transport protein